MDDIPVSDIIFWLQIFFLGVSFLIFLRAWGVRAKIRELEKRGVLSGLKEVDRTAKDPEVRRREAITWRLGYLKWDMSEGDIAYCRRRLQEMGGDYDAVERVQNAPAATIICELLATLATPPPYPEKSFALFAARGPGANGAYNAFFLISDDPDDFQLPKITLIDTASKSVTKDYFIYYHGELEHRKKRYDVRIELGYYN